MSLLGEISKNSEALRYHARTAEIAGQNLAHVNDENYARQRVLAKEGVMYILPMEAYKLQALREAVWIMQGVNF